MTTEHQTAETRADPLEELRGKRLSVSLPAPLVEWVRTYAKERGMSLSAVVGEALRRDKAAALSHSMIVGLLEDSGHMIDPVAIERAIESLRIERVHRSTPPSLPEHQTMSSRANPKNEPIRPAATDEGLTDAEFSRNARRAEYTFDELVTLRRAAQRLSDAIADRVAITGSGRGWEREMDADAEHLAALKSLRALIADDGFLHLSLITRGQVVRIEDLPEVVAGAPDHE